ncbi:MAG: hypothetical protein RIM99_12600 [Cyclobacteriaceae bacterium]
MTNESVKPPVWFWIVSVVALLWNALGVFAYLDQAYMTPEKLALMPAAEQALFANIPAWVTAAFAIAVFGGTIGSLLLLLKKKLAFTILILSLIGIIVQMYHSFFISNALDVYGPGGIVMPIMVLIIGIGLIILAKKGKANGWLN